MIFAILVPIIVGVVVLLLIVLFVFVCCRYCVKRNQKKEELFANWNLEVPNPIFLDESEPGQTVQYYNVRFEGW